MLGYHYVCNYKRHVPTPGINTRTLSLIMSYKRTEVTVLNTHYQASSLLVFNQNQILAIVDIAKHQLPF